MGSKKTEISENVMVKRFVEISVCNPSISPMGNIFDDFKISVPVFRIMKMV